LLLNTFEICMEYYHLRSRSIEKKKPKFTPLPLLDERHQFRFCLHDQ